MKRTVLALTAPCLAAVFAFSTVRINHDAVLPESFRINTQIVEAETPSKYADMKSVITMAEDSLSAKTLNNKESIQESLTEVFLTPAASTQSESKGDESSASSASSQSSDETPSLGVQMIAAAMSAEIGDEEDAEKLPEFSSAQEGLDVFQKTGAFRDLESYEPQAGDIVFLGDIQRMISEENTPEDPSEENTSSSSTSSSQEEDSSTASEQESSEASSADSDTESEKNAASEEPESSEQESTSQNDSSAQDEQETSQDSSSAEKQSENAPEAQSTAPAQECGILSGVTESGDFIVLVALDTDGKVEIHEMIIHTDNIVGFGSVEEIIKNPLPIEEKEEEKNEEPERELSTRERIWIYLRDKGYTEVGAAAIIGNFQQESYCEPGTVQKGFGWSNDGYVSSIKDGTVSQEQFAYDSVGFGLAQWTSSGRKNKMYEFCGPDKIDDLETQLDFFQSEINKKQYNDLNEYLKNKEECVNVAEAVTYFHDAYERSADLELSRRIAYAYEAYEEFREKDPNE